METLEIASIMMLEIDRQTYFNKLQYDRSLTEEQKMVIELRLKTTEHELTTLMDHAKENPDIPQIQ